MVILNFIIGISEEDPVDVNFKEGSYLFLTRKETSHLLEENIAVQKAAGVNVKRLVVGRYIDLFVAIPLFISSFRGGGKGSTSTPSIGQQNNERTK